MPKRFISVGVGNQGTEIVHPEIGDDEGKIEHDGQSYQFHHHPGDKKVVPDGTAVRENVKLDNDKSTAQNPDDNNAET